MFKCSERVFKLMLLRICTKTSAMLCPGSNDVGKKCMAVVCREEKEADAV